MSGNTLECRLADCHRRAYTSNNPLCFTHYMQERKGEPFRTIRPRNVVKNGRKVCPSCLIQKSVDDYYKRRGGQVMAYCKECVKEMERARNRSKAV